MKIGFGFGILNAIQAWKKRRLKENFSRLKDGYLNGLGLEANTIKQNDRFLSVFLEVYYPKIAHLELREMYNLYSLVQKVAGIPGDIAEAGVYKGGSAKIICEVKGEKTFHLFDTFERIPDYDPSVDGYPGGTFEDTSLDFVKGVLKGYPNVEFYKGVFPGTLTPRLLNETRFSFVNLDVDLYRSTTDCLEYFYPRLNKNGILVSHDYNSINGSGVKKAFDEFFSGKQEHVIELWESQCMIIKAP